tara:strand:+ start:117 stop:410 length:294 start_codon:yes stop_codon:yes gene_type:complete
MSYSQRLIDYIVSNPLKIREDVNPNITQITYMIHGFSLTENEKRKEKTDEMPFGKYKFEKVADVAEFDIQYLKWTANRDCLNRYPDVKEIIKNYLKN